ncbi:hypothetical protein EOM71_03355 [Candidatus Falkowbacteria bacterium]|nr:hypothetical protein [Candidatus Falkowbacteria bacterium]
MKKIIVGLLLVLLTLAIVLALWLFGRPGQLPVVDYAVSTSTSTSTEPVMVFGPQVNEVITSPVTISGQARGLWFFEASFSVKIVDANGQLLGIAPAQAQVDWMTEDFVPFQTMVEFTQPSTSSGFIILAKDNPSGLPENDAEVRLPVRFGLDSISVTTTAQRMVKLYYYNSGRDQDEQGNIQCSRQGLVAVERQIPISQSPIKDTLELFLSSPIIEADKAAGLTSEFPLLGVSLDSLLLKDGNLTMRLLDPNNKTSGGSCRVAILRAQLEALARQFPEVKSVKFEPAELFQP